MDASGFYVNLPDSSSLMIFIQRTNSMYWEEIYSGALKSWAEEEQNSLRRRVIFNKPAEVHGDQSTTQSQ